MQPKPPRREIGVSEHHENNTGQEHAAGEHIGVNIGDTELPLS
jgi:hypothetical protein